MLATLIFRYPQTAAKHLVENYPQELANRFEALFVLYIAEEID